MSFVVGDTFLWFLNQYPVWRENPKWPPYRLIISVFPLYFENWMRYLKIKNGICLGILLSRWHDSFISNFAEKTDERTSVRTDHFRFPSYLYKWIRYYRNSNGICSGILLSRWHHSWFWKKHILFCGKIGRTNVQTGHFRFLLYLEK